MEKEFLDDEMIITEFSSPPPAVDKWAALAAVALAVSFITPSYFYLTGNLDTQFGPLGYDVADFLSGPVWGAALVAVVFTLQEQLRHHAPRRMSLALMAAVLSAGLMIAVACIRAANRHHHINHPELMLQENVTVLVVWTTLIAGLTGAGMHVLGWTFLLVGSSGWSSITQPRVLNVLYLLCGAVALFVYLVPEQEGLVLLLGAVISVWQGILFWRAGAAESRLLPT